MSPPTDPENRLRTKIRSHGAISFADFMEEALYGEGGYYSARLAPIGRTGDFVTGSSFSPLFARSTARLLRRLDGELDRPAELLEVGYGSGVHLAGVAADAGPKRRIRGVERVDRPLPAGPAGSTVETLGDLATIGRREVAGLIFAYELFDALPVHRLVALDDGGLGELWVELDREGGFTWSPGALSDPSLGDLLGEYRDRLRPGQIADVSPGWRRLHARLARRLDRGLLVVLDYGFERRRLFDARVRMHGTLACYRRQRVHRNPFIRVGEQDLTAHVDFTALREAGEAQGLETVALTRQAAWLTACGLFEDLRQADDETRREAMKLLDGEGMGQDLRVLIQARGIEPGRLFEGEILG